MSRVTIIGAGIVGAWTAIECVRLGHEVTIVDPGDPGGRQAASYGNGAWIMEASVLPVAMPGLWLQVPRLLLDRSGPLTIRWRNLPELAPWLARFVRSGATLKRVEATARARHELLRGAVSSYETICRQAGFSDYIEAAGHLFVYPDETAWRDDRITWKFRGRYGHSWEEVKSEDLRRLEPGLGSDYQQAAFMSAGRNLNDPGGLVRDLVSFSRSAGARLVKARAADWLFEGDRLRAVVTDMGEVESDCALVCAGIGSSGLAFKAGDRVPLESERGYHIVLKDPEYVPLHPVMPSDGKMAVTMTRAGLRVAGQVELANTRAAPDWRRTDILLDHLHRLFPAIPRRPDPARLDRWIGHRPSTPDGLPCLSFSSRSRNVIYGFGHGHSGIGMAPASARLLAELASDIRPGIDPEPYSARRFAR